MSRQLKRVMAHAGARSRERDSVDAYAHGLCYLQISCPICFISLPAKVDDTQVVIPLEVAPIAGFTDKLKHIGHQSADKPSGAKAPAILRRVHETIDHGPVVASRRVHRLDPVQITRI